MVRHIESSYRAHELPPGFEPDPPLSKYPEGLDRRSGGFDSADIIGSGKFRWCACRVFAVYRGGGRWGRLIKPGETVHMELLRPTCDHVTRKVFAAQHVQWVTALLAQAGGYNYPTCVLPDLEPMDAWDTAAKFGLTVTPFYQAKRDRTALAVTKRAERYASWAKKGQSKAVELADDVARLI